MLDEGMTVAPQVSFDEMVADEGMVCDRGQLIKVELPTAPIHPLLARVTGEAGLIGEDVPRFLDAIERALEDVPSSVRVIIDVDPAAML